MKVGKLLFMLAQYVYTIASIKVDFDLKLNAGKQLTFSSVKQHVMQVQPSTECMQVQSIVLSHLTTSQTSTFNIQ